MAAPSATAAKKKKEDLDHEIATRKLVTRMFASASGSRTFQPKCMSWS